MFEGQVQDPEVFIQTLREFHATPDGERGALANQLSDVIITKRVDLALVRQVLLDGGEHDLLDSLHRLLDLIAPYIEEGGVEE